MESQVKASFIPKKPLGSGVDKDSARVKYSSGGADIFLLIAIIVFVVSAVLGGGVYFAKSLAQEELQRQQKQLANSKEVFDPKLLDDLTSISNRIRAASDVLEKHIAVTTLLEALERDTMTGVQFIKMKYEQTDSEKAEISMDGVTGSVNTVALQSARFGEKGSVLSNPVFSKVDINKKGVTFQVSADIELDDIRYSATVADTAAASAGVGNTDIDLDSAGTGNGAQQGAQGGGFGLPN